MIVRPTDPSDIDRLVAFYAALPLEDCRMRFFSAFRPGRDFLQRWVDLTGDGGYGLVALVDDEVAGEAGYSLLPDGAGELAITIDRKWRGWLGVYLLDALVEAAADRGVPQLQAEVLLENHAMLALIRARGFVAVAHPDWTTVRLAIGTSGRVPDWPGVHERPRVLVEVRGAHWRAEAEARAAGLDVLACPGPTNRRHPDCPLLHGEQCPLAHGADAIVLAFPPEEPSAEAIASGHRQRHPDVALFIEPQFDGRAPVTPEGAVALPACTPSDEVAALIRHLALAPDAPGEPDTSGLS